MKKRVLSILLVLTMGLTLLPTTVPADVTNAPAGTEGEAPEVQDEAVPAADATDEVSVLSSTESDSTAPAGSGTESDPYLLSSTSDIIWFRDAVNNGATDICAKLMNTIRTTDSNWVAIGTAEHPYTGKFDGCQNGIAVLLKGRNEGIFGYIGQGGVVQDLNARMNVQNWTNGSGSIAFHNSGTVLRCWTSEFVGRSTAGGLVHTNEGVIEDSYVTRDVYTSSSAGGIAYKNSGTIKNCHIGGEVARTSVSTNTPITNSPIVCDGNNTGDIINCYYRSDYHSFSSYGTGMTEEEFDNGTVACQLNGNGRTLWRQTIIGMWNPDYNDRDRCPNLDPTHNYVFRSSKGYAYSFPVHNHCVCSSDTTSGDHTAHNTVEFIPWTSYLAGKQNGDGATAANSLPTKSGCYALTENVTLSTDWQPENGVVLCLNGKTVSSSGITLRNEVTITDCQNNNGTLSSTTDTNPTVTISTTGTLTLYGGRISNGKNSVSSSGTFIMNGGLISGNTSDGGVKVDGGSFTMNGGSISDNTSSKNGGGVLVNAGSFTMNGGQISGNQADNGGGVYVCGSFTMNGGSITGNTASKNGGGVYHDGTFSISGKVTINENTASESSTNNVYLADNRIITIDGTLDSNSRIGITAAKQGELSSKAASIPVTGNGADALDCFFVDRIKIYELFVDNGSISLHLIPDHIHCICSEKAKHAKDIGNHDSHTDITFTEWTDALAQEQNGDGATSTNSLPNTAGYYYLTDDIAISATWLPAKDTFLCLNGYSITLKGGYDDPIIELGRNVNFSLTDCQEDSGKITRKGGYGVAVSCGSDPYAVFSLYGGTITGNENLNATCGISVRRNCTFYMYGGCITGNTASAGRGGGISSSGTVYMYDGEITNNTVSGIGGGGVYNSGSFFMSGGTISGNWLSKSYNGSIGDGGGVYVSSSSDAHMFVSGNATITGNTKNDADNNVYLCKGKTFTVTDELSSTAQIGVTSQVEPDSSTAIDIATAEQENAIKKYSFISDSDDYITTPSSDGKHVQLDVHTHIWSYQTDGTTLTGTCIAEECTNRTGGSISIAAPDELTYTGVAIEAVLTNNLRRVAAPAVTYKKKGDDTFTGTPVDAGSYIASITLGEGKNAATATVEYTINPKDILGRYMIRYRMSKETYSGTEITPDYPMRYSSTNWLVLEKDRDYTLDYSNNLNVGTATITVTGIGNYTGTITEQFEIVAKDISGVTIAPPSEQTYMGSEITPTPAVTDNGRELTAGIDFDYSYENNTDVGTAKITITGKGNYTGTAGTTFTIVPKEVTISAGTYKVSKPYDGSTSAGIGSGELVVNGTFPRDSEVTATAVPVNFTDASVYGQKDMVVTVSLTGNGSTNYKLKDNASTLRVPCEITKATLTAEGAAAATAPYGVRVKYIPITGLTAMLGTTPVDGTWSFSGDDIPNVAGTTSYTATFTPSAGAANYNTLTVEIVPGITSVDATAPIGLIGQKDQTLSTVALPDGWEWVDDSALMNTAGDQTFLANYTDSAGNYNSATNVAVTVTVTGKTDISSNITFPDGELTYTGSSLTYETAAIDGVSGGTWTYTYMAGSNPAVLDGSGRPLTVGTYTVIARYEDDSNFAIRSATLTVRKAVPTGAPAYTMISSDGQKLGDTALNLGSITPVGGSIRWDFGDEQTIRANTAYGWTYIPDDTINYEILTGSITPYTVSCSENGSN